MCLPFSKCNWHFLGGYALRQRSRCLFAYGEGVALSTWLLLQLTSLLGHHASNPVHTFFNVTLRANEIICTYLRRQRGVSCTLTLQACYRWLGTKERKCFVSCHIS